MSDKILYVISNIRRIREKKNYTEEYLGACLGVGQNAYSKLELGYTKITIGQLFLIASALDVEPARLLENKEYKITRRYRQSPLRIRQRSFGIALTGT